MTTGGTPVVPPIKGIDLPYVKLAEDVLVGKVAAGDNVLSLVAEKLALRQQHILDLMEELDGVNKHALKWILNRLEVISYTSTKVLEIKENSVLVETPQGQKDLPCDCVILAMGYKPNEAQADELEAAGINVHKIAGAVKTSNAMIANREGFELGMKL